MLVGEATTGLKTIKLQKRELPNGKNLEQISKCNVASLPLERSLAIFFILKLLEIPSVIGNR